MQATNNPAQPPALPRLITSTEKEPYYLNTDSSDTELTDAESSGSTAVIIRTTDLVRSSQSLQVTPYGSPASYRSQGYLEEGPLRAIAHRPKKQPEPSTSPSQPGAIAIPARNPILEPRKLAPDSYGNEIPMDAKWTRVRRSLISPEVLEQDGLRYEAYVKSYQLRGPIDSMLTPTSGFQNSWLSWVFSVERRSNASQHAPKLFEMLVLGSSTTKHHQQNLHDQSSAPCNTRDRTRPQHQKAILLITATADSTSILARTLHRRLALTLHARDIPIHMGSHQRHRPHDQDH